MILFILKRKINHSCLFENWNLMLSTDDFSLFKRMCILILLIVSCSAFLKMPLERHVSHTVCMSHIACMSHTFKGLVNHNGRFSGALRNLLVPIYEFPPPKCTIGKLQFSTNQNLVFRWRNVLRCATSKRKLGPLGEYYGYFICEWSRCNK